MVSLFAVWFSRKANGGFFFPRSNTRLHRWLLLFVYKSPLFGHIFCLQWLLVHNRHKQRRSLPPLVCCHWFLCMSHFPLCTVLCQLYFFWHSIIQLMQHLLFLLKLKCISPSPACLLSVSVLCLGPFSPYSIIDDNQSPSKSARTETKISRNI